MRKTVDPIESTYKWYYASYMDSEWWALAKSRDEAIQAGMAECNGKDFWVQEARLTPLNDDIFDAEWLEEQFSDRNEEAVPEDGLESGASQEQKRELELALAETLRAWRVRHGLFKHRLCDLPRVMLRVGADGTVKEVE